MRPHAPRPVLQDAPRKPFQGLARRLARGEPAGVPLDRAVLLLSAEFQSRVNVERALTRLDLLAEGAALRLAGAPAAERPARFVGFLHDEEGFRGDVDSYDDPRNSFLDQVVVRRTGLPITLAILYVEVARRLGLPFEPVAFPAHFLVRHRGAPDVVVDPFFGRILADAECEVRLKRALGQDAVFDRERLEPASMREILVRMLGNLKRSFVASRNLVRAATCCDRILLLAPDSPDELRDRGLLYEALDCPEAARVDLARYLALAPDDASADTVRERLEALRARPVTLH